MPELIRLGNCGSPIDTEAGGRANSLGVGPTGALLPDHHDPDEVGRPVSQTGVPAEIPAPQCNFCIPPQRQLKGAPPGHHVTCREMDGDPALESRLLKGYVVCT